MDCEEHRSNLAPEQLDPPAKSASSSAPAQAKRFGDAQSEVNGPQKRQATAKYPFRVPPRAAAPSQHKLGSLPSTNSGSVIAPRPRSGPPVRMVAPRPPLASTPDPAPRQRDVALGSPESPGSSVAVKPKALQQRQPVPESTVSPTASQRRSKVEEEAASSSQSTEVPASQGEILSQSTSSETAALSQETSAQMTTERDLAQTSKAHWTAKDFLAALKSGYLETVAERMEGKIGIPDECWDPASSRHSWAEPLFRCCIQALF